MTTTIDLSTPYGAQQCPLIEVAVHLKEHWTDSWIAQAGVSVDRVVWAAAPRIGMAQLYWRYGLGALPGESLFSQLARKDVARWYCRISITTPSLLLTGTATTIYWYGIVEITSDIVEGVGIGVASGRQAIIASGLEGELYKYPIRSSQFLQTSSGTVQRSLGALDCNGKNTANRTASDGPDGYPIFAENLAGASFWSTRDIIRYVIGDHSLRDSTTPGESQRLDGITIPMQLDAIAVQLLPDWDRPIVELHGKSPGQILNGLIARQRLLGWRTDVDESVGTDILKIIPFTFATTDIVISGGNRIKANQSAKHVVAHASADADVIVRFDETGAFDQVIVEGARRRSAFTVSPQGDWGYTLEKGWTAALETEYEEAASTAPNYPAASEVDARRRRNADFRSSERVASVFRRFQLPANWAFTAGDGGGTTWHPVCLKDVRHGLADDYTSGIELYMPSVALMPTLPLLADVDYSTGSTGGNWLGVGDRHEELSPIVLIELPEDPGKYVPIELAGAPSDLPITDPATNRRWSASVRINTRIREPALYIHVGGQPQHVIGGSDFSGLTEDRELGEFDWRTLIATVAIEEERRCFGACPDVSQLPPLEIVRVMRIQAGDHFRQDYMPYGTVLGVDTSGELVKSPQAQWINDDREKLYDLARICYEWYGTQRRILEFATKKVNGHFTLGDLITSISRTAGEDITIGTTITQLAIDIPLSQSHQPRGATMHILTAYAELDPLKV